MDNALQEINVNSNTNDNECGLGDLPDIIPPSGTAVNLVWEPYVASHTYFFPPSPAKVCKCLQIIQNTVQPKRATGYGHKDLQLSLIVHACLETMAIFLWLYETNGFIDWTGSSEVAASAVGKGSCWQEGCMNGLIASSEMKLTCLFIHMGSLTPPFLKMRILLRKSIYIFKGLVHGSKLLILFSISTHLK